MRLFGKTSADRGNIWVKCRAATVGGKCVTVTGADVRLSSVRLRGQIFFLSLSLFSCLPLASHLDEDECHLRSRTWRNMENMMLRMTAMTKEIVFIYLWKQGVRQGLEAGLRQNREQVKTIVIRADTPVTREEGHVL